MCCISRVQIQALPSAIGRLMELALFDASDNKLTTVPRSTRNPKPHT